MGYFKIVRMKHKVETPTGIYGTVSGMSNDSNFRFEQPLNLWSWKDANMTGPSHEHAPGLTHQVSVLKCCASLIKCHTNHASRTCRYHQVGCTTIVLTPVQHLVDMAVLYRNPRVKQGVKMRRLALFGSRKQRWWQSRDRASKAREIASVSKGLARWTWLTPQTQTDRCLGSGTWSFAVLTGAGVGQVVSHDW